LIIGNPGVPFLLDLQLYDGFVGAYVKAYIRNSVGTVFQTPILTHVGKGLYTGTGNIPAIGNNTVQYIVYSDPGFLNEDIKYIISEEPIKIQDPLATQSSVNNVQTTADNIQTSVNNVQTSVDDVSDQIVTLSTHIEDLLAALDNQLENSCVSMTTGIITTTGTQEILAWLEVNSIIIMNPVSCSIILQDGSGNTIYNFGTNNTPLANGFFRYTQPGANVALVKGHTYLAVISIVHGVKTYSAIRALTVLF